jgi:hypothetical protein
MHIAHDPTTQLPFLPIMMNLYLLFSFCLLGVVSADEYNNHLYTLVSESDDITAHINSNKNNNTSRQLQQVRSLHFYALGDVPYLDRDWEALPQQMQSLSPKADFVMHVGDLKRRSTTCWERHYTNFRNVMLHSLVPVFNTIGDNDVVECDDSFAAYAMWQETFTDFDDKWTKPFVVTRQTIRPENFAFFHNRVFVISLHIIHASFQEDPMLYSVVEDTLAWLVAHTAEMQQASAVVMFGHTFPVHPKYLSIKTALTEIVTNLAGTPFLYIQGEKHSFLVDNPIPEADNLLRVIVDKGGIVSFVFEVCELLYWQICIILTHSFSFYNRLIHSRLSLTRNQKFHSN